MRKALAFILLLTLCSTAFGATFSPKLLKLSAPQQIHYSFDGNNLTVPVTVSGAPAMTILTIFTRDQASSVSRVKNGYLGWHYVNKLDTCLYISNGNEFMQGNNEIIWDGKDENGNPVTAGTYTYYLFAFDNKNQKTKATQFMTPLWNIYIQEKGTDGQPLSAPFLVTANSRWVLGNDPEDATLLQTTGVTLPEGYAMNAAWAFCSMVALLPTDFQYFFVECGKADTGVQSIAEFQWVPGGNAVMQTEFGENGFATFTGNQGWEPGVVTDGSFLYSGNCEQPSSEAAASMAVFDFDGTKIKDIDLTDWWSSPAEFAAGGQMNGGPLNFHPRNGYIFLNAHSTCLKQMVNPQAADAEDLVAWSNGNGDYVLDHNFETNAQNAWVCNDYNVGPYTYNIYSDANLFSMCPAYDMGSVSFGLMAPDGSGIDYFAFAGETSNGKAGNLICDNGSAFDGIYASNNADNADANSNGAWFIGQDSVKGAITDQVGVADAAPAAFTVAQNVPNPFNPSTTITFTLTKAGRTTVEVHNAAGQKIDTLVNGNLKAGTHRVTWNASGRSAGVYFYTVRNSTLSRTMKMTLLK